MRRCGDRSRRGIRPRPSPRRARAPARAVAAPRRSSRRRSRGESAPRSDRSLASRAQAPTSSASSGRPRARGGGRSDRGRVGPRAGDVAQRFTPIRQSLDREQAPGDAGREQRIVEGVGVREQRPIPPPSRAGTGAPAGTSTGRGWWRGCRRGIRRARGSARRSARIGARDPRQPRAAELPRTCRPTRSPWSNGRTYIHPSRSRWCTAAKWSG